MSQVPPRQGKKVVLAGEVNLVLQSPLCPSCGYRDITDPMLLFGCLGTGPSQTEARLVLSAGRRLDTAHRLVERLRESLEAASHPEGIDQRRMLHVAVGDAELMIIALGRAVEMACRLPGDLRVREPLPAAMSARRKAVGELRDAYEHIDDRALGRSRKRGTNPLEAFAFGSLFTDRRLRYGSWSLGVDAEATALLEATRGFLIRVWADLNARASCTGPPG